MAKCTERIPNRPYYLRLQMRYTADATKSIDIMYEVSKILPMTKTFFCYFKYIFIFFHGDIYYMMHNRTLTCMISI